MITIEVSGLIFLLWFLLLNRQWSIDSTFDLRLFLHGKTRKELPWKRIGERNRNFVGDIWRWSCSSYDWMLPCVLQFDGKWRYDAGLFFRRFLWLADKTHSQLPSQVKCVRKSKFTPSDIIKTQMHETHFAIRLKIWTRNLLLSLQITARYKILARSHWEIEHNFLKK